MGIRIGISVFLGPSYRGGKDRIGRPGSRVKEIGFEREREREREREGETKREGFFCSFCRQAACHSLL